jgi:hypothetical protein
LDPPRASIVLEISIPLVCSPSGRFLKRLTSSFLRIEFVLAQQRHSTACGLQPRRCCWALCSLSIGNRQPTLTNLHTLVKATTGWDEVKFSSLEGSLLWSWPFSNPKSLRFDDQTDTFPFNFRWLTFGKLSAVSVQFERRFSDGFELASHALCRAEARRYEEDTSMS